MTRHDRAILIVEDDEGLRNQLKWHFDDFDTTLVMAGDRAEALSAVRLHSPLVVIQDLGLPPEPDGVSEGFQCLSEILSLAPYIKIIVLTGKDDHANALRAIELGAFDFYLKPIDPDELDHVVARAFHVAELEQENLTTRNQQGSIGGIITNHPDVLDICRIVERIAPSDVSCLLLGESGTGKEIIAATLHAFSDRPKKPFVAINCAAIPENLIESELFGHEKGAFTGADRTTTGRFETAQGGTLLLDEIGDMPLILQAKMLRFLQERYIERVGGRTRIPLDVRVICATHRNLEEMVREGTFREDLYYRIAEISITIPPLRDRDGDKALLARHFLRKYAIDRYAHITGYSSTAIAAIENYHWPGNVREMENRVRKAIVMSEHKLIQIGDLGLSQTESTLQPLNLRDVRMEAERKAVMQALSVNNHNVTAAAKYLGVTRPTLYDMLHKYALLGNSTTAQPSDNSSQ